MALGPNYRKFLDNKLYLELHRVYLQLSDPQGGAFDINSVSCETKDLLQKLAANHNPFSMNQQKVSALLTQLDLLHEEIMSVIDQSLDDYFSMEEVLPPGDETFKILEKYLNELEAKIMAKIDLLPPYFKKMIEGEKNIQEKLLQAESGHPNVRHVFYLPFRFKLKWLEGIYHWTHETCFLLGRWAGLDPLRGRS